MSGSLRSASNAFRHFASLVFRFRWMVIIFLVFCTAFFVWRMQGLDFDNSEDIWFVKGDPSLRQIKKFRQIFGNDDFVYIIFDSKIAFKPDALRLLQELSRDLNKNVPHVKDITWLGNAEYMEGKDQSIHITDFLEPDKVTDSDLPLIRKRALKEKLYRDNLISSDARTLGMYIEMMEYPEDRVDPRSEVAPAVRATLNNPRYQKLLPYVVGQPILHHDYNMLSLTESRTFFGFCLLIQMILLVGLTKGIRGLFVPLVVVILSVIWTMGMIHVLGYTLNLFIILVPTLLVCIGIGDSMHIIANFNRMREGGQTIRESMIQTLGEVGPPCLLTTLTTAAGFLSFNAADIRPFREMGVYASIGTVMALLLSLLIVPLAYSAFCKKDSHGNVETVSPKKDIFDSLFLWIYRLNVAAPRRIIALFILILGICVIGYFQVKTETNTARMLSTDLDLRQAYDSVDERMGGSMSVEIMLDTGTPDGVKNLEFLNKMNEMQRRLGEIPFITKTVSILDILKRINRTMHEEREEFYTIPPTQSAVAQYMMLYEMSNGRELEKLVSFERDVARLTAKTRTLDTQQVRALSEQVDLLAKGLFGDEVKVELSGNLFWVKVMNDLLGRGQQKSFLTAIIVVSLFIAVFFRSLRIGLISIVPNVFPIIVTLGLMGHAGLYMDMPLMSFSAIIIGVAVDDTVHFLYRYRKEFERTGSYEAALKETLVSVGRPLLFTTLILATGFSVLLFSDLTGVAKFGGLAGFAFTWALLADFFFVPSLILVFKCLGKETAVHVNAKSHIRLFENTEEKVS